MLGLHVIHVSKRGPCTSHHSSTLHRSWLRSTTSGVMNILIGHWQHQGYCDARSLNISNSYDLIRFAKNIQSEPKMYIYIYIIYIIYIYFVDVKSNSWCGRVKSIRYQLCRWTADRIANNYIQSSVVITRSDIRYNMILHATLLQWLKHNIIQTLNSQLHLHILPSQASYGVSVETTSMEHDITDCLV